MTVQSVPADAWKAAELFHAGELGSALQLAEASVARSPCPEAYGIIAGIWEARGAQRRATLAYRKGIALFPHHPVLTVNYARLLRTNVVRAGEAVQILEDFVRHEPDFAPARLSLIETLRHFVPDLDAALAEARRYVARFPTDGEGYLALALTLFNRGELRAALEAAEKSLAFGGKPERAWELKANILVSLGAATEALGCYRALLDLQPHPDTHSRLLMTMQYCDTVSEDQIYAETESWVRTHVAGVTPAQSWPNITFDPERPLSIGVLSRDFRMCSTLFLARPLFENLPPDWTVAFYSNVECPDIWTTLFRGFCENWIDVSGADDDLIAQQIAADAIDVLVDLNGHTLGGRPLVFARKPAPVQVAWLDYVGTTGLTAMDAIIADAGHLPLEDQPRYIEPIKHVTRDLYRYAPPNTAPPVAPLPALRNGFVTFGCFNSAYKISDTTVTRWAQVLRALRSAKLLLNAPEYSHADTRTRFTDIFAAAGVPAEQIIFRPGAADPVDMLRAYADVDIALDPTPYSGGLTTIEGLYMGVPVVTLPGKRFGSRHSSVHLRAVGLEDWIAADEAAYVHTALERAKALPALAALRAGLRGQVEASALLDGPGFARDFCAIARDLWRSACGRTQP